MINSFSGPNRFLSNFYPSPITHNGLVYPTAEHMYQALKTTDLIEREHVRLAATPAIAKKLGRSVTLQPNWFDISLETMLWCLRQKFNHPSLAAKLLATGDQELIEGNTWGDTFWGVCQGVGENHLGRLLMQVRDELR
jgi:ribA/ribD-fused uncharacterized protein